MAATHRSPHRLQDSRIPEHRVIEPDALAAEREADGFDLKVRGYARDQVEERIREWAAAYDAIELERDQLATELTELRAQPVQLSPLASMSIRVREIVEAAETEAQEALAAARHEADAILAEAQQRASDELNAAARERAVARGESDRLVDGAQVEADRLISDAQNTYARLVGEAQADADRIRAALAVEEEQILSGARLEAAELERSTTRQREIAEAEHNRLLSAHANQQKQYAAQLRADLEELEGRRREAEAELARLRQLVSVPATATPQAWDRPTGAVASFAAAPAPVEVPVDSMLHSGDTGETLLTTPVAQFEPLPQQAWAEPPRMAPPATAPPAPVASPPAVEPLRSDPASDEPTAALPRRTSRPPASDGAPQRPSTTKRTAAQRRSPQPATDIPGPRTAPSRTAPSRTVPTRSALDALARTRPGADDETGQIPVVTSDEPTGETPTR